MYGDDGRGTLVLSRVAESDSGVYVCTASDGAHVSVDEAQVIVVEAAEIGGAGGGGGTQGGEEETPWSIPYMFSIRRLPVHRIQGFDRLTVRISPDYIDTATGNRAGEAIFSVVGYSVLSDGKTAWDYPGALISLAFSDGDPITPSRLFKIRKWT